MSPELNGANQEPMSIGIMPCHCAHDLFDAAVVAEELVIEILYEILLESRGLHAA